MKKNLFLLVALLWCISVKAQITFTASVSPVYANDAYVTITAQGETTSKAVDMSTMPNVSGVAEMISPNNQGYSGFFSLSNLTRVSYYNPVNGTKSSFTAKVNTGGFGSDATIKFNLAVTFINLNSSNPFSYGTVPLTLNTKPGSRPATVYYSAAVSGIYTRNNCGVGYIGSSTSYTIPAGSFTSTISQADANQKAVNWAQADINANGTCSVDYSNWITSVDWPLYSTNVGVEWNVNLVSTPTVKFEVYQNGVFMGVANTNVPNNGLAFLNGVIGLIVEDGAAFRKVKLKIVSETDPNIFDFSPEADWFVD